MNQNGKFNLVNDGQLCQTCHNLPLNKHQLHVYCIMHVHTVIIIFFQLFVVIVRSLINILRNPQLSIIQVLHMYAYIYTDVIMCS